MSEYERVLQLMRDIAAGVARIDKLNVDEVTKTVRPASACCDPDTSMAITPSDMVTSDEEA